MSAFFDWMFAVLALGGLGYAVFLLFRVQKAMGKLYSALAAVGKGLAGTQNGLQQLLSTYWKTEGASKKWFEGAFGAVNEDLTSALTHLEDIRGEWGEMVKFLGPLKAEGVAGHVQLPPQPIELRARQKTSQETLDRIEQALIEKHDYSPGQARLERENIERQLDAQVGVP